MDLQEALEKLYSLHTFGVKLGLENITGFLNEIGSPQKKLKCFHVAGSNGKGSTSAFIASMLYEFGYKTGLYTSPHFIKFNERIKVDGIDIPDEYVAEFINRHNTRIDERKLTFFEVTTAMAFCYFAENRVDYAVIETGLGGRLDATNVLNPLAVIITSISLEHTNILGGTIEQIAAEKAAIIKKGTNVFLGQLPDAASSVAESKAAENNASIFYIEDYINHKGSSIELYTEEIEFDDWTMPLRGSYQKYNAALAALAVIKTLGVNDYNHIHKGIKNVISNTGIQGRYEYFSRSPAVIFDSAHNEDGLEKFLSEFIKEAGLYSKTVLLFGAMKDKAIGSMLKKVSAHFDEIYFTSIDYERAATIEELNEEAAKLGINAASVSSAHKFVLDFKNRSKDECLVVLGSMYLLGEIKSKVK